MLFLLGAVEGVVGCFFYAVGPSYAVGPVPAAPIGFAAGIFATCLLAAWGMLAPSGALAAAIGWFLAAFILATVTGSGSVVVANTTAGKWFLFGGSAAVIAATIAAFTRFARASARPRR